MELKKKLYTGVRNKQQLGKEKQICCTQFHTLTISNPCTFVICVMCIYMPCNYYSNKKIAHHRTQDKPNESNTTSTNQKRKKDKNAKQHIYTTKKDLHATKSNFIKYQTFTNIHTQSIR